MQQRLEQQQGGSKYKQDHRQIAARFNLETSRRTEASFITFRIDGSQAEIIVTTRRTVYLYPGFRGSDIRHQFVEIRVGGKLYLVAGNTFHFLPG